MQSKLSFLAVFAALMAYAQVALAASCATYGNRDACDGDSSCQWFLNKCIDLASVNCKKIKEKKKCSNTAGCKYYPEFQWWFPKEYADSHIGDFKNPPVIGCDTNTMCNRLTTAAWCNGYSHCGWVDGECKTAGTPPDPKWVADCTRNLPRRKQNCLDLGPQCKYVNMNVCDDKKKNCQNVLYGCRKSGWCGVNKGPFIKNQCELLNNCVWSNNRCSATPTPSPTFIPTSSPTLEPTNSPTQRPTTGKPSKAPTSSPTRKPTTLSPTKQPTNEPTPRPTPPTTPAPTLAPTPPTTRAPTNRPTTLSPTRPKCPVTKGAGEIVCRNQPFAQLAQTFPVPTDVVDKEYYCTELCAEGGFQGAFGVPVFPGCRAYTFDGSVCRLFGCYVDGAIPLDATVIAAAGVTHGTLTASCYESGKLPTSAPTTTCLYTNEAKPPVKVANRKPLVPACTIYTAIMSADYRGDYRTRLDWCQEGCTNVFGSSCTGVELWAIQGNDQARCLYANCTTSRATSLTRDLYRSFKTSVC